MHKKIQMQLGSEVNSSTVCLVIFGNATKYRMGGNTDTKQNPHCGAKHAQASTQSKCIKFSWPDLKKSH